MLGLGKVLCKVLGFATVADDVGELDGSSNAYHFPKKQVVPIVATSVTYFCPSHTKAVLAFEAHPSGFRPPRRCQPEQSRAPQPLSVLGTSRAVRMWLQVCTT